MSRLAALKATFGSDGNRDQGPRENFQSNNYYPFWNMKPGQRAVIRFLPDLDPTNPRGFLLEKSFHVLNINGKPRNVPDLAMYGEEDPISKLSQQYYAAGDKVNGKKYWRKKQYLAQAIVVEDPLPADPETGETHQGKVRVVTLGFQIYNLIKDAFANVDEPFLADPDDFEGGYDFIIKKTEQGEYSTYVVGTKFMSRQRPLTDDELVAAKEGMVELKSLLPKNPGVEKVQALLDADMNGGTYTEGESAAPAPAPRAPAPAPAARRPIVEDDDVPFDGGTKVASTPSAPKAAVDSEEEVDDMLAQIRARRKAAAAE
jgi:hypothetical protein